MNEIEPDYPADPSHAAPAGAMRRAADEVRHTAEDALSRGEEYVRANPVPVVLGALAVGIMLGMALGHREEESFRERYVDEPLDHARGSLYAILAPVLEKLRSQYSKAEEATEKECFNPFMKELRRAGKKIRFW